MNNLKFLLSELKIHEEVIYSDGRRNFILKRGDQYVLMAKNQFGVSQMYISKDIDDFVENVSQFSSWCDAKITKKYSFEV